MTFPFRPQGSQPPGFVRLVGGLLLIMNLLAIAASAWLLAQNRRHYRERAEIQSLNLAEVLEENVDDTIERIDLAIQSVKEEVEHDPASPRERAFLKSQFHRTGLINALGILDNQGKVRDGAPSGASLHDAGDRDFFLHLQRTPGAGLYLSAPFRMEPGDSWQITLARRLDRPDGGFSGVVFANLPLDLLAQPLGQLNVGPKGAVSLRSGDLRFLARHPLRPDLAARIGDPSFTGPYLQAIRSGRRSTQFTARSVMDGEIRTYTLQRIEHSGLFILVGLSQRDYLQPWWHQVIYAACALLIMILLTLALGWQTRASWIRHLEDQKHMRDQEEKYRVLAENASAVIWTLDPDGRLTFVSPSIFRQRGWTSEEFMALDPSNRAISGEYADGIRERILSVHHLPPGSQPFERDRLEASVVCRDGREIQIEAQWRVVWGADGRLLGFQGVSRDVSDRKQMEAERDSLILELTQTIAEVKTLSGLLPICSRCKKVRGDHGYWDQIESYLSAHTSATFTHGLCPDCAGLFRQEIQASRDKKE